MTECYRTEEEGHRLNALTLFLHQQGFPQNVIEKYRMVDEALERDELRICPFCLINDNKKSGLNLLPTKEGKEVHKCGVCSTEFLLAVND
jgi:hypothetical protein